MQSQVETLEGRRVVSGVPGVTAPSFQVFFFFLMVLLVHFFYLLFY